MILDIIYATLIVAILFTVVGIYSGEIALTMMGAIAWIATGVGVFNVEIPFTDGLTVSFHSYSSASTTPFGFLFVMMGIIAMVYVILGVNDYFNHRGGKK